MKLALEEAQKAYSRDEVPIGAVIIDNATQDILAKAGNETRARNDPTAHAEIVALRIACEKLDAQRIPNTTLYVSLEPCAMCAAAISFARIDKVIFGASDAKGGGVIHGGQYYTQPTCNHRPETVYGLLENECGKILKDFFTEKRKLHKAKKHET